jgi:hypothetical protein
MSATIISPDTTDTTLLEDGQPASSITPADIRQMNDSLAAMFENDHTGNWTIALNERGTMLESMDATAQTLTIPPHSSIPLPLHVILGWRQYGAGTLTIAGGAGVTLRTASSLIARGRYATGGMQQRAIDEWVVWGDLA